MAYIAVVLPESGRVLGIDVGYSKKRRTTGFCCLSWTEDKVNWSHTAANADDRCRSQALLTVRGLDVSPFLAIAIDGPLKPRLEECHRCRTVERVLSRGAFQKRGKPGQTNAGSGPLLHKHATLLANLVVEQCAVETATMPFAVSSCAIYEAFPNLFLGFLCPDVKGGAKLDQRGGVKVDQRSV